MVTNIKTSKGKFAFVETCNINEGTKKFYNYEVVGFAHELTEEQWNNVVDFYKSHYSNIHKNYVEGFYDYTNNCPFPDKEDLKPTAIESGQTLMQSLDLEGETWILIKYL